MIFVTSARRRSAAPLEAMWAIALLGTTLIWAPPAIAQERGGDQADEAAWGNPVVENFDTLDEARWYRYPLDLSGASDPRRDPRLITVDDGLLRIGGGVDADGNPVGSAVGDRRGQTYGRWEVRFRVDKGTGYGAAILLWPQSERWPDDGEIDLIEIPSPQRDAAINSLHNGPDNLFDNRGLRADFSSWHTVAVDWVPGSVTFYLDGAKTWVSPSAEMVPSSVMRLALQLDECAPQTYGRMWIPCRTACSPDSPHLEIDWVKVYPLVSAPEQPPAQVPEPSRLPPPAQEPPCDVPGASVPPAPLGEPSQPVAAPPAAPAEAVVAEPPYTG